jgi:cholesterol transport system auxiliary component
VGEALETSRPGGPPGSLGRAVLLATALTAALGGCSVLIPQSPNAIFDLSAPADVAAPRGNMQVLVPEPTAVRALDTDRIAARPSDAQYAYLGGAVWSDRLPKLVQARLVQMLQNSGRVRAAAVPGQGLLIDFQLVVDIRAFELTSSGAVADFAVRLMNDSNGRVVRSRVFRAVVPVTAADARSVVPALDQAMDQIFAEIADWMFRG